MALLLENQVSRSESKSDHSESKSCNWENRSDAAVFILVTFGYNKIWVIG